MFQQTPKKRVLFKRTLISVMTGLISVAAILYGGFVVSNDTVYAATNNTVNFQARLQNISGSVAPDGNYNVQLKLYAASSGGAALWTETYYDANGVTAGSDARVQVKNGYLSLALGSQTAFPTTINWDQDLYLTMNIGGRDQTATPTYDGEMNPRLKLTGVPYAFRAGSLAQYNSSTGFTSILKLLQPTVGDQIFQITDQGAAGTYSLLTQNQANTNFIQNQNVSAQTTSNFWISGTGIAGTYLSGIYDTATNATLSIGTNNATTITVGRVSQQLNINSTIVAIPAGNLTIGGSTQASNKLHVNGTVAGISTGSHYGIQNEVNFNPSGASLNAIYGLSNIATLNGSSLNIGLMMGASLQVQTAAGYTGQVADARGVNIAGPIINGSQKFPVYSGLYVGGVSANAGNTSGTIDNRQINILSNTAGAGTGGTLVNYGISLAQPAGSGGTTSNFGLYLYGAGAGTSNWSLYNTSGANSYFGANVLVGTASNANGYKLQVGGGINASTGYNYNGTAGSAVTCTGGNVLQNTVVQGGIITGGTCVANGGGVAPTLQNVYDNSATSPAITLSTASGGGMIIQDASTTVGGNLFAVQNNGGATKYLAVTTTGSSVAGTFSSSGALTVSGGGASITGGLNNNAGGITSAGAVSGVTTLAVSGTSTLSATGGNALAVTGAPTNSATSSLVQIGAAINGGNVVANGGTYFGLNAPGTGAGSVADFLNFQTNGTYKLKVTSVGLLDAVGGYAVNGVAGVSSTACTGGQVLTNIGITNGIVTSVGTCVAAGSASPTLQNVYDNSSSPASILLTNAKNFVVNAADTTTDPNILFNLQCVTSCSTNGRFAVQNSGVDLLTVNPNGTIILGTATNGMVFSSGGSFELNGTARRTHAVILTPEYLGAVLDTGGLVNVSGTMTSGHNSTNRMNYYKWTTSQTGATHSYDVVVTVPVPSDFSGWAGGGSLEPVVNAFSSNLTTSKLSISVLDTAGVATNCVVAGGTPTYVTPTTANTWQSTTASCGLGGTYAADGTITIRVRMTAQSGSVAQLGNIVLNYYTRY